MKTIEMLKRLKKRFQLRDYIRWVLGVVVCVFIFKDYGWIALIFGVLFVDSEFNTLQFRLLLEANSEIQECIKLLGNLDSK